MRTAARRTMLLSDASHAPPCTENALAAHERGNRGGLPAHRREGTNDGMTGLSWSGRRAGLVAAAATLLAALALAGSAGAATKIKKARFEVAVTATQTTSWSVDRKDPFETCGLTFRGSGEQTMRLATKRPAVVHALHAIDTSKKPETQAMILLGPLWRGTIAAPVTVDRSGTMTTTPNSSEPCGDGGGGPPPPPPAPDCGRRRHAGYLSLAHFPAGSYPGEDPVPLTGVLALDGPKPGIPSGLYRHCPFSGDGTLLLSPRATMTARKVFGKGRRFTIRARARKVYDSGGNHHETTMRWKATFTRLAKGRLPRPKGDGAECVDGIDNDGDGSVDDRDPDCWRTGGRTEG